MVAWVVLIVSGMFETVWATALAASDGFRRLGAVIVFFVACGISMGGLAFAMRSIPVGTSYAVWAGIGAIGTAGYGMYALGDPISVGRILCLGLIVTGIVGLKLLH